MKKTFLIEAILTFLFVALLVIVIYFWRNVNSTISVINLYKNYNDDFYAPIIENYSSLLKTLIGYGSVSLLALLADLAAMVLIAIKDFPVFHPLVEKAKAKSTARKQSKEQSKAARAEANKQARIEQLQAELDELKKD